MFFSLQCSRRFAPRRGTGLPPLGGGGPFTFKALVQARQDPLRFYLNAWKHHGDTVRFEAPAGQRWYLAVHPEAVRHVLVNNAPIYRKPTFLLKLLRLLFGEGVTTTEGETWRGFRRRIQPPLLRSAGQAVCRASVVQAVKETVSEWESERRQEVADVCAETMALALKAMCCTLFGSETRLDCQACIGSIRTIVQYIGYRISRFFCPPMWIPSGYNRQVLSARRTLDESVAQLLLHYRASCQAKNGLLSQLLESQPASVRREAGEQQLRDMVRTLLIGAAESVGTALCWAWVLTARHPAVEQKLLDDLESASDILPSGGQDPAKATYARMIFQETLRLYPVTWLPPRRAITDDTLHGFFVPRGTVIVLSQYLTHRHPEFWHDPEKFIPERFAPESHSEKNRQAYFPFGLGSHLCAGMRFALFVGPLLLAELVRRYHLELVSDGVPEVKKGSFFLEPATAVGAILRRRTNPSSASDNLRARAERLVMV